MIFFTNNIDFDFKSLTLIEAIEIFRKENPGFCQIFEDKNTDDEIREQVFYYLYRFEINCLQSCNMTSVQRYYSQQAIRVLKNLFSSRHESVIHFSVLTSFNECINKNFDNVNIGFMIELIFLFRALKGKICLNNIINDKLNKKSEWNTFDKISKEVRAWMKNYPNGLDEEIIKKRMENKRNIKKKLNISEEEWDDWKWQSEHVLSTLEEIEALVELSDEDKEAIKLANESHIPFAITPYYLSLFDISDDVNNRQIRYQALPSLKCIKRVAELNRIKVEDISKQKKQLPPEISITRGYPMIAIFKPIYNNYRFFSTHGEKNWEINYLLGQKKMIKMEKIDRAIRWFERHKEVTEVLITGDILILDDIIIEDILSRLADINHIQRIRVSTRVLTLLPIRITDSLIHLLSSYQITGRREISLMTSFEHPIEVTLDAMKAIQKLRKTGIHVYNQSIYTMGNVRRFEMAALRKQLRLIGVDPYYSFNAKKEIQEERVPIARMMQEQNEESRLAPGIDRADEAVFSIPGVGKNYLRASQEHELITILGDGSRVYEFYPSDVYLINKKPFIYRDISIYNFMTQLANRGEDIREYQSIWFYY